MDSLKKSIVIEKIIKSVRKEIKQKRSVQTLNHNVSFNEAKPLVYQKCDFYGINPAGVLRIMQVYEPKNNSVYRTLN